MKPCIFNVFHYMKFGIKSNSIQQEAEVTKFIAEHVYMLPILSVTVDIETIVL